MQAVTENIAVLILISMLGGALLTVSFILVQIRNRNLLLRKSRELQDAELNNQKSILYATIASQEQERERIGMDLHDEVGSQLSWLRLMLENNLSRLPEDRHNRQFTEQSKNIIDGIINNVRSIAHDLSPRVRDMTSLLDSLRDTADRMNRSGPLAMTVDAADDLEQLHLDGAAALGLYRVVTELVNNTIKHAQASQIELLLEQAESTLRLRYADNGVGLPADLGKGAGGRGLQNIENRVKMMGGHARLDGAGTGYALQIEVLAGAVTP